MTARRLIRTDGVLVRAYKLRIARTEEVVSAEDRCHAIGRSTWLVSWILLDDGWTIWRAGDDAPVVVQNGHAKKRKAVTL